MDGQKDLILVLFVVYCQVVLDYIFLKDVGKVRSTSIYPTLVISKCIDGWFIRLYYIVQEVFNFFFWSLGKGFGWILWQFDLVTVASIVCSSVDYFLDWSISYLVSKIVKNVDQCSPKPQTKYNQFVVKEN